MSKIPYCDEERATMKAASVRVTPGRVAQEVSSPMRLHCSIPKCDSPHQAHGFCNAHYHRWRKHGDPLKTIRLPLSATALDRFWAKVDKSGPVPEAWPELGRCWLWMAGTFSNGYGGFYVGGRKELAHRWVYQQEVGLIPEAVQCDHLCRVRQCVRSSHIELVSCGENLRRGVGHGSETHCAQGHPYNAANTYLRPNGGRNCRACNRILYRRQSTRRQN